jgi:hypothetical protein
LFSAGLVVLDIVLNNTMKKEKEKNQAQRQQLKTGHVGRERFVIFSTQVPDRLTYTPKHVQMRYQPNLESIFSSKVLGSVPSEPNTLVLD